MCKAAILKLLVCLVIIFLYQPTYGTHLNISNTELQVVQSDDGKTMVNYKLSLSWENAWHNASNHDAVWLFFKLYNGARNSHGKVTAGGHQFFSTPLSKGPKPAFYVPEDGMGVFVYPEKEYRGTIHWELNIQLDTSVIEEIGRIYGGEVFGLEMVHIPEGKFTLGDPDQKAQQFGAFYQSDEKGASAGLYTIESEGPIPVGGANSLYYKINREIYQGDQKGPVPQHFPKGYKAFYMMKYELTQGQYAAFLNTITADQTQHRANFGGRDYYNDRGGIIIENGIYKSKYPNRPLNYSSWDDGMAYADWAGLRPMTELEFTKASRGPSQPIGNGFCWGSGSKHLLQRYVNPEGDLVMASGLDESTLNNENKELFGASYYWVMDLTGSVWERLVTIGHSDGRNFSGSHGDGNINNYGFATNEDWPKGVAGEGGIGFRGGGFYESKRDYHEFNPHSPIAYRRYGAWHGWNRTISYGQRFVRTSDD